MVLRMKSRFLQLSLLVISTFLIVSCGQGGKGSAKNPPRTIDATNPFAGREMARRTGGFALNMTVDEVRAALDADGLPPEKISQIQQFEYDDLGRFVRQTITSYPQSPNSIIPPEGALTLEIKRVYNPGIPWQTDVVTMDQWGFWWDGDHGKKSHTVIWTDHWENNLLVANQEETIRYDINSAPQVIANTTTILSEIEYNTAGYSVASQHWQPDVENGFEYTNTNTRASDGITLIYQDTASESIEFTYLPNGALAWIEFTNKSDGRRTLSTMYHLRAGDDYVVIVEHEYYTSSGDFINSNVEFKIFERTFCHESNIHTQIFQRPDYRECLDLEYWDAPNQ